MHEFFVSHVYPPPKATSNSKRKRHDGDNRHKELSGKSTYPIGLLIDTIKSLWPGKRCTFSVGKYNSGNYIAEHDDHAYVTDTDGTLCSRDLAVIYYLTKDWKKEDGGILIDLHDGKRKQYVPKFNSLVAFEVPRFHEVTAVLPRVGRDPRYSVFGWFLEEGDIYSYAAAPAAGEGMGDGNSNSNSNSNTKIRPAGKEKK
eukprot:CAMPEP_0116008584 /NCGR_PEP_ID=MMETSP0321-20121206/2940_1 /TAXON_ID=163516 /ORGANISM="Leptocylindrus danicus var. danicus, Strain B650" /LENGTH=199 /DNA_ID=CAMNT_0003477415 /DNA_START=252 /DNA_END=848 /DNA_ORIENTATION=-